MLSRVEVRKNSYHDSVLLMAVSRAAASVPGVADAVVVMGSDMNKEFLAGLGLLDPAAQAAGPEDLIIAIQAADEPALAAALAAVAARLREGGRPAAETAGSTGDAGIAGGTGARAEPLRSLDSALRRDPAANLALISVPGPFAAREARRALAAGLHVLLYSDHVSIADEVALKRQAADRGLLMMGPDCGTAIIAGAGLGFANVVRRGAVGMVAAAGTGLQEVACLLDRMGAGVSHAIGTGGRDLSAAVGGLMMMQGLRLLAADPDTRVLVLVSKPPDAAVAGRVRAAAAAVAAAGKAVVACFLGGGTGDVNGGDAAGAPGAAAASGITLVPHLQAAARAAALAAGLPGMVEAPPLADIGAAAAALAPDQRYVRGLFSGGTLCDQAALALTAPLDPPLGPVYSNTSKDPARRLAGGDPSHGHSLWDLGDDYFTLGRPHPMIDPAQRLAPLAREAADPTTAVILLDVVLGHGAHPDPAGVLAPGIAAAHRHARAAGRALAVVCSVTGTDADPQRYPVQVRRLQEAGAVVAPTAWQAARCAAAIAARRPEIAEGE